MKLLLPLVLPVLGLAAGAAAGLALRQPGAEAEAGAHAAAADDHAAPSDDHAAAKDEHAAPTEDHAAERGHAAPAEGVEVLAAPAGDGHGASDGGAAFDYVKLTNQFIVPLVENGRVGSMMVLSLGLEVTAGTGDTVYAREPKLRDALLQVLFDHANAGGFDGRFTEAETLLPLRRALREAARTVLSDQVNDVLIADIVRHDS